MGRRPVRSHGRRRKPAIAHKNNRKPDWVVAAVINLRAHQPKQGMGTLAQTFNRLYAASRNVTVSKSYVHYTVRRHQLEIEQERRRIRQRSSPYRSNSGPNFVLARSENMKIDVRLKSTISPGSTRSFLLDKPKRGVTSKGFHLSLKEVVSSHRSMKKSQILSSTGPSATWRSTSAVRI